MKASFALLIALAVLLGASAAGAAEPDPADAQRLLDDPSATVKNLELPDVALDSALKMLSRQFNLSIITANNVNTNVKASFKDVTLRQALDSLVTINGFAYRVKGNVIEVYQPGAAVAPSEVPDIRAFPIKYGNVEHVKKLLAPFVTSQIGKMEAEPGGNRLIVYDTPSALQAISRVVDEIDRPEPQVTIGAEIIEAAVGLDEKLGIDWEARIAVTGAVRPITFPFPNGITDCAFFPSNSTSTSEEDGSSEFTPGKAFPNATREDFTFGTIDASGLKIILNALKSHSGTNLIANPEITTLNNHEAKINIGDTVPVPIFTTNLETGVSAVTGFEEIETGTILSVVPLVNEGRMITLKVRPEISEIIGFKGQFDERPVVASRRAETTVRVHDGQTIVIGGLVKEKTEQVTKKLPIFGDLPLIGWFFRNNAFVRKKSSLYIFLTPRINDEAQYKDRARRAAVRLARDGVIDPDTGVDDFRPSENSPFHDAERTLREQLRKAQIPTIGDP